MTKTEYMIWNLLSSFGIFFIHHNLDYHNFDCHFVFGYHLIHEQPNQFDYFHVNECHFIRCVYVFSLDCLYFQLIFRPFNNISVVVVLFISTDDDPELPIVKVNVIEVKDSFWYKVRYAFKYAFQNYYDQFDWVLKCNGDTFVILKNFKLFLLDKDYSKPYYSGLKLKPRVHQGYMYGGNVFMSMLSKAQFDLIIIRAINN